MSKKDRLFWESARYNNQAFLHYYNRLTELAISMFEWKNLPDSVDERFMELALFRDGKVVFFKDPDLGYLALRVNANGPFNVYEIPMYRHAYASNHYTADLTDENSVIIYNNYLHTNSMEDVEMYSRKLGEIDRTIEVNAKAQKTPVFIQCDENQRLTMMNLYKQYDGNQPFIFGDKNLNPNSIKVFTTNAPYMCENLYQLKTQYMNEALTNLGISNVNITKKERLISDEVIRNQGGTIASRYSRLNMRRRACEEINKMFPELNIKCNYREDYREADDEIMFAGQTGDKTLDTLAIDLRTN